MNKKIQMLPKLVLSLCAFYSLEACFCSENTLISQASKIQRGMRIAEVINILGSPKYAAIIELSKVPRGWDQTWNSSYEEVLKKHSKVLFYVYSKGVSYINVCFDLEEQRVIHVAVFFSSS